MAIHPTVVAAVVAVTCVAGTDAVAGGMRGQGERVAEAAVVNGVPQGLFVGRSLLTGRAVCLLFLGGGRITRAIPDGGLEHFDWLRHHAAHPGDSGRWEMRGGQLVVTWGDGGVHQGPLTVRPDSIEFYGKRYSKPVAVRLGAIAGRWESARGTAVAGGPGINTVSSLILTADGRYQWVTTDGGVVAGRAVAGEESTSGEVLVTGLTITFAPKGGVLRSYTFLPAAGQPVTAFSIDANMFTRSGPAPTDVPLSSDPSSRPVSPIVPGTGYHGLQFTVPAGWTSGTQQGQLVLAPADATPDAAVVVVVAGAEPLGSHALDDWFAARMAGSVSSGVTVLQAAPAQRGHAGALETLSAGRTIQDENGAARLQIYYAISDGRQAGLLMVVATSEAAMAKNMSGLQALIRSLSFSGTPASSANPPAHEAENGAGARTVKPGDLVGSWSHANSNYTSYTSATGGSAGSSTVAYGQGYTFAADGTFTYRFTGMMDSVYLRERDSGTWAFEGGALVLRSREHHPVKTYSIVQHHIAADGTATMTLLARDYPITESNVAVYGERYVRQAK